MVKRITHRILAIFYLGVIVVCVLLVIKPGASIFYSKMTIDNQSVVPDAGFAYRYDLKVSPLIFRTQSILVYEDGHLLNRTEGNILVEAGTNAFSIGEQTGEFAHIYFAASDNSNPITNGRKYTLYLPITFISRPTGIIILIILLPGLAWFLYFALALPDHRKTLLHSSNGIGIVLDHFFETISEILSTDTSSVWQQIRTRMVYWKTLFTITILVAYFYIFMEWVFFVTMPSFMSLLNLSDKLEVFLLSGLGLALFCLGAMAIIIVIDTCVRSLHFPPLTGYLGIALPSIILSFLGLILIDNFTYTVFKFGISTSVGIWRGAYGLIYLILSVYIYLQMIKFMGIRVKEKLHRKTSHQLFYISLGLLVLSIGLALVKLDSSKINQADASTGTQPAANHPNVLLLGSDGLSADYLSAYGYTRDTTPRLRALAQSSLVAENAFTNSGNTAGSVISIMTSKLPTQSRVLYPPDILTGLSAYQHLPGMLKSEGYKTIEFGVPYYVDAYSFNLQDSFDMVNNRTKSVGKISALGQKLGYENTIYFLNKSSERISERILHLFYIHDMENPYHLVTQPVSNIEDEKKISQLLDQFDQNEVPLFIHAHLLGTHGGYYSPPRRVYSKGERQTEPWMEDFYADTILAFDNYIGEVIDQLKAIDQFENTILIIYTDHGQNFQVNERIPLIIHFPEGKYAGRLTGPTENIDIAPTILDYLGLSIPDWMTGKSLLQGNLENKRLVFSMGTSKVKQNEHDINVLDPKRTLPPFYQFSFINIINCQKWYLFDLTTFHWSSGDVSGSTNSCTGNDLLSFDEIKQEMANRLATDGFDISSLP